MARWTGTLCAALLCWAAPASGAESLGPGSGDEERSEETAGEAAPPKPEVQPQPETQRAPPEAVRPAEAAPAKPAAAKDYVPATSSVSLDLGGALNLLGGYAYPRIVLDGTPDHAFHLHGRSGGLKLHVDFPAQDLDWRFGLDGTLPGYAAVEATVGIRKDLGPWINPRLIMRAAGGVEFLCAGGANDAVFLLPAIVGKGEAFLEFIVVENLLSLGVGFELGLKWGIPAGLGVDAGSFVRTELWF